MKLGPTKRCLLAWGCAISGLVMLGGCQVLAPVVEVWGSSDDRELEVAVDTCNRDPDVTALESEEEVRLKVSVARSFALNSNSCGDAAKVVLDEPLGDRRVIDDSNGAELEVQEPG
ncbi:hypothetical protein [uncultured Serinicoccus sp.]|uniref:hypothetical protein n=1 Tax=uncultured Serinicoccus sp. TaxID=735514 RepID=UPI00262DD913|nr:hypothetical protein [uncultured Serinicoccus sp.]